MFKYRVVSVSGFNRRWEFRVFTINLRFGHILCFGLCPASGMVMLYYSATLRGFRYRDKYLYISFRYIGNGSSACYGDSGGPLSCMESGRYVLHGVTSFGAAECRGYPTVFAKVSEYVAWIDTTMESNQGKQLTLMPMAV